MQDNLSQPLNSYINSMEASRPNLHLILSDEILAEFDASVSIGSANEILRAAGCVVREQSLAKHLLEDHIPSYIEDDLYTKSLDPRLCIESTNFSLM